MNEAPASMPTTLPKGPLVIPCPPPYSRGGPEIFLFRLGLGSFFDIAWAEGGPQSRPGKS